MATEVRSAPSDQQKSVLVPVQSPSLPDAGPVGWKARLLSASSCQFCSFPLPTRRDKWADRWAASAVTSRFVGPIAAPCSFPLRGFWLSHLSRPTPTNRRPARIGGRATFEKNSMAPNSRSPYPCLQVKVWERLMRERNKITFPG